MYDTTFPPPEGGFNNGGSQPQTSYSAQSEPSNEGGYQKKPWQGGGQGNEGGYQKKPWQGGGGQSGFQKKPWTKPVETDFSFYKPVAMMGNNDAPPEAVTKMCEIAKKLEALDYTVRIGGLPGLEDAIEKSITKKEVHLPFKGFDEKQSKFTYVSERAMAIAKMFFPNWDAMKKGVQFFLAKNARVLMGQRMESPALFMVCWTEDGVESAKDTTNRTGFTAHPIAIASALGIPVFNIGNSNAEQRLNMYLESLHHV